MRRILIGLALVLAVAGTTSGFVADENKLTVKEVMKAAHGGGQNSLLSRVKSNKASDADKAKLVELYESMIGSKPKKGDVASYQKLCDAMLVAAKAAKNGDSGWQGKLNKATNCKGCHDSHK